jgi:hypothetical protein
MTGGAREPSFPTFVPTSAALIRHVADAWGERPFVALGGERLTYAEVERRSARLAKGMLASGVGKGTRVGLLAPNGPDWVVAWFAATRIGAVAVMLNTYNKAAELARTLRHGDVALLVTIGAHLGTDYLDRVEAAAGGLAEQRHRRLFVTELRTCARSGPSAQHCGVVRAPRRPCRTRHTCRRRARRGRRGAPRSDGDRVLSSTAEPKAPCTPTAGSCGTPTTSTRCDLPLRRRALHADAAVLGGRVQLHPHRGDARRAALVFEERFEPGATLDRSRPSASPRCSVAAHGEGARRPSDVRAATFGGEARCRRCSQGRSRRPTPRVARHDRDSAHTFDTTDDAGERCRSFGRSVPGVEHQVVDPETGTDVGIGDR